VRQRRTGSTLLTDVELQEEEAGPPDRRPYINLNVVRVETMVTVDAHEPSEVITAPNRGRSPSSHAGRRCAQAITGRSLAVVVVRPDHRLGSALLLATGSRHQCRSVLAAHGRTPP
jgi:hypothetical protein